MALRSIYPPCRQRLPHQACSNQDEIWGRASSWVSNMRMAGWHEQLLAGGHIRPSTSAQPFENSIVNRLSYPSHASSHPALSTAASPPAIDLSLSQNLRRSARLAANCVPAPQSCSPQCHPVLLPRRQRPLIRPIYPPLRRLRLDAGDALHVLARASAFSRLACPALHFVAVSSTGCISLTDVRLVHDPIGGGC